MSLKIIKRYNAVFMLLFFVPFLKVCDKQQEQEEVSYNEKTQVIEEQNYEIIIDSSFSKDSVLQTEREIESKAESFFNILFWWETSRASYINAYGVSWFSLISIFTKFQISYLEFIPLALIFILMLLFSRKNRKLIRYTILQTLVFSSFLLFGLFAILDGEFADLAIGYFLVLGWSFLLVLFQLIIIKRLNKSCSNN